MLYLKTGLGTDCGVKFDVVLGEFSCSPASRNRTASINVHVLRGNWNNSRGTVAKIVPSKIPEISNWVTELQKLTDKTYVDLKKKTLKI